MLINKRRNGDPATAGDNVDLDITTPRLTEETASFSVIWRSFWDLFFFFFERWWNEGDVSRRKITQLWRSLLTEFIQIYKVNLVTFYGLPLSTHLSYFFPRTWYAGFLCKRFWGEKITKHHKKSRSAISTSPSCHSTNSVQKPSSTAGSD